MGFLQGVGPTSFTSGASVQFPSNTTPGSLLVVVLMKQSNAGTFSISDSGGQNNHWTIQNGSASYPVKAVAYALNTVGGTKDSIVLTNSGGGTCNYALAEYSGVNALRGITAWAEDTVGSTVVCTTTNIATTAGDLLLGVFTRYSGGNDDFSSPSGMAFRQGTIDSPSTMIAIGDIAALGGSQNMSASLNYYGGLALLAFYKLSTGVPNSLALMGCGV